MLSSSDQRAEEALQQSEIRFRTLIERAPFAIMVCREGAITSANQTFNDMWGIGSAEETGSLLLGDMWAPEVREEVVERTLAHSRGEDASWVYTSTAIRRDGTRFTAKVSVTPVQLPDGPATISFIEDLTEREAAATALRESNDRFSYIAETIDEVFWIWDRAEGRFLYVSPAFEKVWGRAIGDLADFHLRYLESIHPDDRVNVGGRLGPAWNEGEFDNSYRIRRPDGTLRWIHGRWFPLRGPDGQATRAIGRASDITRERDLESQFRQAQKMEAIGVLAGGVAHDFNNLLSVILSYSDFIGGAVQDDPALLADVNEITKAARRAVSLTQQLLAFSRKQVLEPQVLNLNKLAIDLDKMMHRLIGEHFCVKQLLAADLGNVRADPGQIQQVILNLVVNARDAMPRGGTITVATANVDVKRDRSYQNGTINAGAYVVLSISDTGTGMDDETRQRLFEPFYTTKEVGKGTGLGLSTVQGIITQSEGHVTFTTELGASTTFNVYLPRIDESPQFSTSRTARGRMSRGDETILLVEDDDAVRTLIERVLRNDGYEVISNSSGDSALVAFDAHSAKISMVLTDIVMPGMSGTQLVEKLRALSPTLPVLYMSGYSNNEIAHHGILQQGVQLLAKPFTGSVLVDRVRQVLDTPVVIS